MLHFACLGQVRNDGFEKLVIDAFYPMRSWCFLSVSLMFFQCVTKQKTDQTSQKLNLLILSGRNNHEWEKTTPLLVKMYKESGRFETQVTASPDTFSYEGFSQFDAVVSNWTAWPEHDYRWSEETEQGFVKYIENGGGFVLFHAASATFYDWQAFREMVGTTWDDRTVHGKIAPHRIVIKDRIHPITKGVSNFWITDELWVNAGVHAELNVLAESYSDPSNKGRGKKEPVVHWNSKGKGRIFHNILGHNERAIKNTGWKTLMLRGTEWAATGEVSIPVPPELMDKKHEKRDVFSWRETDTTLAMLNHNEILWQFNFNTIKGKPFFHPVKINNSTLTWLSPGDHPWHLGIWHSWKFINGVNYWEYDRTEGVVPFDFLGVTEVRNIGFERRADYSCRIYLDIYYHEKGGPDLIREERMIKVSAPDEKGRFFIDYKMNLAALAESVELHRTPLPHEENGKSWGGYAGLSVRFNQDLFEPSFINSDGTSDMNHGKSMPWKYYGLRDIKGNQVGVAIFTHPENLNYPEPWFMTNAEDHPFYYFSPAPIFNRPYTMKRADALELNYRMRFYTGEIDHALLKEDYNRYLNGRN
ncbi:MAG: PmoA family protein [Cytophagales bacterium]|nr:PmoA family protein [Cytophagales bacterium]